MSAVLVYAFKTLKWVANDDPMLLQAGVQIEDYHELAIILIPK